MCSVLAVALERLPARGDYDSWNPLSWPSDLRSEGRQLSENPKIRDNDANQIITVSQERAMFHLSGAYEGSDMAPGDRETD
jgi:hypothetical protein